MKTPFYLTPCTRGSLLLLVFTTLSAPSAQCGLPFKRTLGAIKERVTHVVRRIGSEVERDSSRPNRPDTQDSDLRYGPPPLSPSQQPSTYRPSINPDDTGRNPSEVIYSASVYEPAIILRKPQSTTAASATPVTVVPGSQPVDAGRMPALRDLPVKNTTDTPASTSSSTDLASKNTLERQPVVSPQPVSYARHVPGHPGFVYPPGVKDELKNMLDVRGCASGEKMRDPRTGSTFLVP